MSEEMIQCGPDPPIGEIKSQPKSITYDAIHCPHCQSDKWEEKEVIWDTLTEGRIIAECENFKCLKTFEVAIHLTIKEVKP